MFEAGRSRPAQYWDIPSAARRTSPRRSRREAVSTVPRAARGVGPPAADGRRAARHVPLRRLDSSAIAALMARMIDRPLQTFSVAFKRPRLQRARIRARRWRGDRRDAHEVVIDDRDFFGALPRLIWHEDEPIAHPSSVPLLLRVALAREHVKVVLTGEGSDELLGRLRQVSARAAELARRRGLRRRAAAACAPDRRQRRSAAAAPLALRAAVVPGRASQRPKRCSSTTSPPSARAPARPAGRTVRAWPRRSTPTATRVLRRVERRRDAARSSALHRHEDLSRRAADEAGPDEHGRVDREPRARSSIIGWSSSPPACRRAQAARPHDEMDPARVVREDPAARDSDAPEDGLPGALRHLDARRLGAALARRAARSPKPRARHHRAAAIERLLRAHGRRLNRKAAMPSGLCSTSSFGIARSSTARAFNPCRPRPSPSPVGGLKASA